MLLIFRPILLLLLSEGDLFSRKFLSSIELLFLWMFGEITEDGEFFFHTYCIIILLFSL